MWVDYLLGTLAEEEKVTIAPIKQNEYVGYLQQLVVSLADLKASCQMFVEVFRNLPLNDLQVFDAHVSDCGCHLRALMLMDLFRQYSLDPSKLSALKAIIIRADNCISRVTSLLSELCEMTKKPQQLLLPLLVCKPDEMLQTVECDFDCGSELASIKFLYYSYVLSKHKSYSSRNCKDSVIIDVESAVKHLNAQILSTSCQGTGKLGGGCRYLKHARITKGFIKSQTALAQSRLSHMSVSYLKNLGDVSAAKTVELLCRQSPKCIAAIPAFFQYKILEKYWAEKGFPFFLAMRVSGQSFSDDVYAIAHINSNLEWGLTLTTSEHAPNSPHMIVTFSCSLKESDSLQDNLGSILIREGPRNMRACWYSFMARHKQYPFDMISETDEQLKTVFCDEFDRYKYFYLCGPDSLGGINFTPKHIFFDCPAAVVQKQKYLKGKDGVLLI